MELKSNGIKAYVAQSLKWNYTVFFPVTQKSFRICRVDKFVFHSRRLLICRRAQRSVLGHDQPPVGKPPAMQGVANTPLVY